MMVIRFATREDKPALQALIVRSARALSIPHYTSAQIEAALQSTFGVDSQLIADQTYFVAEEADVIIGCGGWSKRATLFGADQHTNREPTLLSPETDAARIRAFFIEPTFARRGVARALLRHCETAAFGAGFRKLTLMATLSGVAFYQSHGYATGSKETFALDEHTQIEFVPMSKLIAGSSSNCDRCRR
jgi:GNAT superfamily N-acetyltransferase